jgi:DNA invertase Pin-like site-specific DNA recombinase
MSKGIRVAAYYRISADPQGLREGVGRQRTDCRARADRETWTLVDEYEDNDASASTSSRKKRPRYAEMISKAEAGAYDVILAYSNSRLTRRPMELEDLINLHERTGVRICTVVSGDDDLGTADGRMVARIKASVDAAEAERTSERARRAKAAKRARGEYVGGARRFGFGQSLEVTTADGRVILSASNPNDVNEAEAALIRQGAQDLINGLSVRHVMRTWNASGITGVRGGTWIRDQVKSTLRDSGNVPKILDQETFNTLRAILSERAEAHTCGSEPKHWLSGVITCGICDNGTTYGYYRKVNQPRAYRCQRAHNSIVGHLAEAVVTTAVVRWYFLNRTEAPDITKRATRTISEVQTDRAALINERSEIEQDIEDKIVTRQGMRSRLIEIRDALEALNTELRVIRDVDAHEALTEAAALAEIELTAGLTENMTRFVHHEPWSHAIAIRQRWDGMSTEAKKQLLTASFRVVVSPGRGADRIKVYRDGLDLTNPEPLPGEPESSLVFTKPLRFLSEARQAS